MRKMSTFVPACQLRLACSAHASCFPQDDERTGTRYNYAWFHVIFILATMYVAMLLTNWYVFRLLPRPPHELTHCEQERRLQGLNGHIDAGGWQPGQDWPASAFPGAPIRATLIKW